MGVIVLSSNYLVQFPINHYGLNEILTYGAFTYPIAFLITDLANRSYGKLIAQKIVYLGFFIGVGSTILFSTNFQDLISIRIAFGSGIAFFVAQLLDVQIFDRLRKKKWFIAPLTSSIIASVVDTFLFFSISFFVGLWAVRIPDIKDQINVDYTGMGYLFVIFSIGSVLTETSHQIEAESGAHLTTGGVWTNSSSRKRKKNIRDIGQQEALYQRRISMI